MAMWGDDKRVRITTIAVVIGLVLIAFVGVETPIAHGLDFMRLQNGTQVPNSLGIGSPNSTGVTLLPNGTFAAFINGGGPGSTIGPVHVYRSDDGKHVWASAIFQCKKAIRQCNRKRYRSVCNNTCLLHYSEKSL